MMLFPKSKIQAQFSIFCLLVACFSAFSFNHIVLTKYHFLLGQAPFYCIVLALLTSRFCIPQRSLIFMACFLTYCLGSAALMCYTGQGLCTRRPYTAALSVLLVFLIAQYVADLVNKRPEISVTIEKAFVYSAWALVILAMPDIWIIAKGGVVQSPPYGVDLLAPLGFHSYASNRLQGFTQEPSYFGMVISTLYPITFMRLNQKWSFMRLILVISLWVCLAFSFSRTGLFACAIITLLILALWPKRLLLLVTALGVFALAWNHLPQLRNGLFFSFSWIPSFSMQTLDGSSLVRFAHIVGALNVWLANPLLGVGLGQSGFVLNQFYPVWYTSASPEYANWVAQAPLGGVPSLSFLPKLLAEIGLLGSAILIWWALPFAQNCLKTFQNPYAKTFAFAFLGFLIASFGVDGYLYLPAWIIFGVLVGLARKERPHNL